MDPARIREHARATSTEYLLDQVTVYRAEMESAAIDVLESELRARGVRSADVDVHKARREEAGLSRHPDGTVIRCTYCPRPAIEQRWRWHRLWGWFLPLFLRLAYVCSEHRERLPTDSQGKTVHYDEGLNERGEGSAGTS
jgi:hypothetical protein